MSFFLKKKLVLVTVVYWVLLLYIVAALVWWFVALSNQNKLMAQMRLAEINKDDSAYLSKVDTILKSQQRKTAQYIGEGSIFLILILVGAVFVYRATRRQIKVGQQQQNFMMAVTHELKTPIAIAMLNLETLQKRKLEEVQQQKLISNTLQETNRLNGLCNNILLASQLDGGLYNTAKQEINFSNLVQASVKDFQNRFPQRTIQSTIASDVYLNGEELLLQMLLNNLIENALKYSLKEQPIKVILTLADKKIQLKIIDTGIGVAIEERKKIFEKFYRSGNENTRKTKGTGLGLYLCKKIMQGHNGYIGMTNNEPQGSIFTATFNV
jgi:two-component system, OmpR family, sensor histidine kinase CiaH